MASAIKVLAIAKKYNHKFNYTEALAGGAAYDIKSQGKANPIAQILSASLMLSYSFGLVSLI